MTQDTINSSESYHAATKVTKYPATGIQNALISDMGLKLAARRSRIARGQSPFVESTIVYNTLSANCHFMDRDLVKRSRLAWLYIEARAMLNMVGGLSENS